MTGITKTHRFYISPDHSEARWIRPIEKAAFKPDWIDLTDLESEELAEFLMRGPSAEHQLTLPLDTDNPR